MPIRGKKATLRDRPPIIKPLKATNPSKSKFAAMGAIDCLKWGFLFNRNVNKGWLRDALIKENVLDGKKAGIQKRFWGDYKEQELFMQEGMQACVGDDFEPKLSKQKREENGDFGSNKNGVPQNILTVKYILHAYGLVHNLQAYEEG